MRLNKVLLMILRWCILSCFYSVIMVLLWCYNIIKVLRSCGLSEHTMRIAVCQDTGRDFLDEINIKS